MQSVRRQFTTYHSGGRGVITAARLAVSAKNLGTGHYLIDWNEADVREPSLVPRPFLCGRELTWTHTRHVASFPGFYAFNARCVRYSPPDNQRSAVSWLLPSLFFLLRVFGYAHAQLSSLGTRPFFESLVPRLVQKAWMCLSGLGGCFFDSMNPE